MNTITEIENHEADVPLHHLVERDYCRMLGLMLHIDAKVPGLFGDIEDRRREHAALSAELEAEGVALREFSDGELLNVFAKLMGLALSSGGMSKVLESYKNAEGESCN